MDLSRPADSGRDTRSILDDPTREPQDESTDEALDYFIGPAETSAPHREEWQRCPPRQLQQLRQRSTASDHLDLMTEKPGGRLRHG